MKAHRTRAPGHLFPTPDEAENAFYEAFERCDLAGMMAVWAEDEDVVCVHPQGPRLVGLDAVRESWARIFAGAAAVRVRRDAVQKMDGPVLALRSLIEVIGPATGSGATGSVHATNVYELQENGWRMVLHHASPVIEPPPAEEPDAAPHTLH